MISWFWADLIYSYLVKCLFKSGKGPRRGAKHYGNTHLMYDDDDDNNVNRVIWKPRNRYPKAQRLSKNGNLHHLTAKSANTVAI